MDLGASGLPPTYPISVPDRVTPTYEGGECVGPNPTDRGKPGSKRHVLVDAGGIPLALLLSALTCTTAAS